MQIQIDGVTLPVQPSKFEPIVMDLDDGETTTRTADGQLTRDRIAVKRQINLEWPPLQWDDLSVILQAISNVFFDVTYPDPETGQYETKTFYPSNRTSPMAIDKNGVIWWSGLSVTLTEQ